MPPAKPNWNAPHEEIPMWESCSMTSVRNLFFRIHLPYPSDLQQTETNTVIGCIQPEALAAAARVTRRIRWPFDCIRKQDAKAVKTEQSIVSTTINGKGLAVLDVVGFRAFCGLRRWSRKLGPQSTASPNHHSFNRACERKCPTRKIAAVLRKHSRDHELHRHLERQRDHRRQQRVWND